MMISKKVEKDGRRPLDIDIFKPATPNGVAVILLHGGGWAQGHRASLYGTGEALAKLGFVAIAAEYRLLPEAPWPSQLEDVRDVVRWTRENAEELGVAPDRIALQGYSAGGHLALLVAGTQTGSGHEDAIGANSAGAEVAAVVSFFAPARLDANPAALAHPPFSLLLNGGGVDAARAASPIYYIGKNFPTTFIIGGTADYVQPLSAGLDLLNAFTEAGAEVEFHYLHSQVHEFSGAPGILNDITAEVGFFYRRTLLEREALRDEQKAVNPFARASNMQEFMQMMASAAKH